MSREPPDSDSRVARSAISPSPAASSSPAFNTSHILQSEQCHMLETTPVDVKLCGWTYIYPWRRIVCHVAESMAAPPHEACAQVNSSVTPIHLHRMSALMTFTIPVKNENLQCAAINGNLSVLGETRALHLCGCQGSRSQCACWGWRWRPGLQGRLRHRPRPRSRSLPRSKSGPRALQAPDTQFCIPLSKQIDVATFMPLWHPDTFLIIYPALSLSLCNCQ